MQGGENMELAKRKSVPKGFIKTVGAMAPKGYAWYNNGKSRFSGQRKIVLVKVKRS